MEFSEARASLTRWVWELRKTNYQSVLWSIDSEADAERWVHRYLSVVSDAKEAQRRMQRCLDERLERSERILSKVGQWERMYTELQTKGGYRFGYLGLDESFRPVFLDRVGSINVKFVEETYSPEDVSDFLMFTQWWASEVVYAASRLNAIAKGVVSLESLESSDSLTTTASSTSKTASNEHSNEYLTRVSSIIDLDGLGMSTFLKHRGFVADALAVSKIHHPVVPYRSVVVNASRMVRGILKIVLPWLDDATSAAVICVSDKVVLPLPNKAIYDHDTVSTISHIPLDPPVEIVNQKPWTDQKILREIRTLHPRLPPQMLQFLLG